MPMIAMTREMGSLGKDVAAGIAGRGGRKVVYQEIIEPIANKMRLRKSHVERFLEGRSGIWERLTTDRTSLSIFTADEMFRFLREPSTGVLRGWGAVHLLKNIPHVVRVRVCAPLEIRIQRMMERLGTDNREAVESEIELSEEAHTAITRRHFGVNWRDAENYDLILNTDRLTVDECIDQVDAVMKKKAFQETPETLRMVDDLALEWSMRSSLRRDPRTAGAEIAVQVQNGIVQLVGMAESPHQAIAAGDIAAALANARGVDNQLRIAGTAGARLRLGV